MRKKILGLLLIGLTTLGITQAYDYYSIYPGLEMEYKGLTYTCDTNANCTTTDQNNNTFNGLFFTSNNYGNNGRAYAFFYDNNNEGYLSQFRGYIGGTYTYSQRSPIQGCFGTYEKAMGDFHSSNNKVCDWGYNSRDGTGNANTGNTLTWLSDTSLAGQLYSIRFSPFGDEIIICYNYGTGTQSFCFISQDNQGSNINYGIDFNTAYGQVFTSKLSLLPAGNSPRVGGGGSDGEQTTINYACPTIQQLINTYPSQYNTGLCYSSSLIFSGGTIEQVEPKDIFTLYPQYTGFVTDINLYNNYCVGPNTQTACETAFQGKTEQYTLISKIPDNVKKANLYAYCNLQLNYEDKNASTCVTSGAINTGEYIPPITNQGVIDELIDGDYNIVLPASGYVMDTLKDENGERKIDWNIIESIQNLYSKFTTIFTGREGNNGIIPEYITRMLLVIILFAFFKK